MMIEMGLMLVAVTKVFNENSLINDATVQNSSEIVATVVGLYVLSLILKLLYYSLHPWPVYAPNWDKLFKSDISKAVYGTAFWGFVLYLLYLFIKSEGFTDMLTFLSQLNIRFLELLLKLNKV